MEAFTKFGAYVVWTVVGIPMALFICSCILEASYS